MKESIPQETSPEKEEEYETVKRELIESLDEPAFMYYHSDGQDNPNIPQEEVVEESREVRVYFPHSKDEVVVTLVQETEPGEGILSIAEQIQAATQKEGVEPSFVEYTITSYKSVVNNVIQENKEIENKYLNAFIPYEEIKEELEKASRRIDKDTQI